MSILDNYTQDEIDMMSDEVIQAHKDVDAFSAFIKSLPSESDADPLAKIGAIK